MNGNICIAYYEFWSEINEHLSLIPYNPSNVFVKQLLQSINTLLPKTYQSQKSQSSSDNMIAADLVQIESDESENSQNFLQINASKLKSMLVGLCSSTQLKSMHNYKELVNNLLYFQCLSSFNFKNLQ